MAACRPSRLMRDPDHHGRDDKLTPALFSAPETRASRRSSKYRARLRWPRLRPESPYAAAVGKPDGADRHRRGTPSMNCAESLRRQRPDLDLDGGALAVVRRATGRALAAPCRRAHRACNRARSWPSSSKRPPSARNSPLSGRPDRCAPTTATAISPRRGAFRHRRQRRLRHFQRAERQLGVGMKDAADLGQPRVVAAGRQQRDAERQALAVIAAGSASPQRSSRLTKLV